MRHGRNCARRRRKERLGYQATFLHVSSKTSSLSPFCLPIHEYSPFLSLFYLISLHSPLLLFFSLYPCLSASFLSLAHFKKQRQTFTHLLFIIFSLSLQSISPPFSYSAFLHSSPVFFLMSLISFSLLYNYRRGREVTPKKHYEL